MGLFGDIFDNCNDCAYCQPNNHPIREYGDGDLSDYRTEYDWSWCTYHQEYHITNNKCYAFQKKQESDGCFLTSACVAFKNLPDDCEVLTKLRAFRDTYLAQTTDGKALVQEYYAIAPALVENINARENKADVYQYIYDTATKCVTYIDDGKNEDAVALYRNMVEQIKAMTN